MNLIIHPNSTTVGTIEVSYVGNWLPWYGAVGGVGRGGGGSETVIDTENSGAVRC